jgi:hypothetical protein
MEQFGRPTRVHNLFHPADLALCRADVFFSATGVGLLSIADGLQGLPRSASFASPGNGVSHAISKYQAGSLTVAMPITAEA